METYQVLLRLVLTLLVLHVKNCISTTVPDPCAGYLSTSNKEIVTMCEDGYAREDNSDGSTSVDSVVLRVMKQQGNCKCHISFKDQTEQVSIFAQPYEGYSNTVPDERHCGLAIETHLNTVQISTIQCPGNFQQQLAFLQNGEILELTSRMIDGSFTRGYCLQFFRVYDANRNFHIQIKCFKNIIPVTEVTTLSDGLTQDQTSLSFRSTHGFRSMDQTIITTLSDDYVKDQLEPNQPETSSSIFVALTGVFAGTTLVMVILFILVAFLYKRNRTSTRKRSQEPTQQSTYDNLQSGRDNSASTYSSISTAADDREQYEYVGGV